MVRSSLPDALTCRYAPTMHSQQLNVQESLHSATVPADFACSCSKITGLVQQQRCVRLNGELGESASRVCRSAIVRLLAETYPKRQTLATGAATLANKNLNARPVAVADGSAALRLRHTTASYSSATH